MKPLVPVIGWSEVVDMTQIDSEVAKKEKKSLIVGCKFK
jgi:hypothetical protein